MKRLLFIAFVVMMFSLFFYLSGRLVSLLEAEERAHMEIWAEAYKHLFNAGNGTDVSLELKIIESNKNIPVLYTEEDGTVLGFLNYEVPADTASFFVEQIKEHTVEGRFFEVNAGDTHQYLYYGESILLSRLRYYPVLEVVVVIVMLLSLIALLLSYKHADENRVWVGLTKETAHQLGTPIQSLMAWMEMLRDTGSADPMTVSEMTKDVDRLHVVADRFSKIGSAPKLENADLCAIIQQTVDYMQKRTSRNITISASLPHEPLMAFVSAPLFSWVIENLCKNAVDAEATKVTISLLDNHTIEVSDNGHGMSKQTQKQIFKAGFTTKQRGWGLGLTLARRIICQYHNGYLFVKQSEVGVGTVFRIEI